MLILGANGVAATRRRRCDVDSHRHPWLRLLRHLGDHRPNRRGPAKHEPGNCCSTCRPDAQLSLIGPPTRTCAYPRSGSRLVPARSSGAVAPPASARQDVELPAGGLGAVVPLLAYARQSRGDIVIAMVKLDHYHTHERLAMMAAKLGLPQSFTVRRAVPRLLPVAHRPRMHRRRAVRAPDEVNRVEV